MVWLVVCIAVIVSFVWLFFEFRGATLLEDDDEEGYFARAKRLDEQSSKPEREIDQHSRHRNGHPADRAESID